MRSITEAPINEQTRGWLSSISIFFFVWLIDYVVSIQTNKQKTVQQVTNGGQLK